MAVNCHSALTTAAQGQGLCWEPHTRGLIHFSSSLVDWTLLLFHLGHYGAFGSSVLFATRLRVRCALGTGDLAQWVKLLSSKHNNLNLNPQNPCGKARCSGTHWQSQYWGGRDREIPEVHWTETRLAGELQVPVRGTVSESKVSLLGNDTLCCPLASTHKYTLVNV